MKLNNTLWAILIISIVAIVGLILIFKTESITGQTYNYGANFGPQGQRPVKDTDNEYRFIPKQKAKYPSLKYCDIESMVEYNLKNCPEIKEIFDEICISRWPPPQNSIICPDPSIEYYQFRQK